MPLTKFHIGEKVHVIKFHPSSGMFECSGLVGFVIGIDMYYRVRFNVCIGGEGNIALFEERELYSEEPTDIMEFLKHRLCDNN